MTFRLPTPIPLERPKGDPPPIVEGHSVSPWHRVANALAAILTGKMVLWVGATAVKFQRLPPETD
jgi:hypothetical protein